MGPLPAVTAAGRRAGPGGAAARVRRARRRDRQVQVPLTTTHIPMMTVMIHLWKCLG